MDRVGFSCSGCSAKLSVGSAYVGRTIVCPKCQHKVKVPAFEVIDEPEPEPSPPPPPPAELLRFPCIKCGAKLRVSAELAGRAIPCPKCGANTLVPDREEIGDYGLARKTRPTAAAPAPERPIAEWWPDGTKLNLPFSWRVPLASARGHAEHERWTKALGLLNDLFQKGLRSDAGTHVIRKPLAFCLGRWAVRELDRFDEEGGRLSPPIRTVLKRATEMQRFGGSFHSHECPLCARPLHHLVGTRQVRTIAGSAYLCCAAPTRGDDALVQAVERINKKLAVGMSLDSDNAEIPMALARIPDWYRAVDMAEYGWTRRVTDTSSGGGGGGGIGIGIGFGGDAGGEIAGELAANIISGLLGG